jgi:hypothetical protein
MWNSWAHGVSFAKEHGGPVSWRAIRMDMVVIHRTRSHALLFPRTPSNS